VIPILSVPCTALMFFSYYVASGQTYVSAPGVRLASSPASSTLALTTASKMQYVASPSPKSQSQRKKSRVHVTCFSKGQHELVRLAVLLHIRGVGSPVRGMTTLTDGCSAGRLFSVRIHRYATQPVHVLDRSKGRR